MKEMIRESGFTGIGAKEALLYIFGVPVTALFVKQRVMPQSIPNEIFIPGITSVTVFILATLNKIWWYIYIMTNPQCVCWLWPLLCTFICKCAITLTYLCTSWSVQWIHLHIYINIQVSSTWINGSVAICDCNFLILKNESYMCINVIIPL